MNEQVILAVVFRTLSARQIKALAYVSRSANAWKATSRLKAFVEKILETAESIARTEAALSESSAPIPCRSGDGRADKCDHDNLNLGPMNGSATCTHGGAKVYRDYASYVDD